MGECPDWYDHIRAAKFLGVAPWDLLEQPVMWKEWAIQAANAEAESQKQRRAAEERRNRAMGR